MHPFDVSGGAAARPETALEAAHVPSACPACQSTAVTTTAKVPDVNTYWRCTRCGEVWNLARRHGVAAWR
jgi:transposase-like protein